MAKISFALRDASGNALTGWTAQVKDSGGTVVASTALGTITDHGNGAFTTTGDHDAGEYSVYACAPGGTPALVNGYSSFRHVEYPLPADQGGTGVTSLVDLSSAMGLGDLASESVAPVAMGGTGATTASQARTNLGLAISTDVQPYSINTTELTAALATAKIADVKAILAYDDGTNAAAFATIATIRTLLGLGTLYPENSPLAVAKGGTGSTTAADARTSLGLGTAAVYDWTKTGEEGKVIATGADAAGGYVMLPQRTAALTANAGNLGKMYFKLTANSYGLYVIAKTGASSYVERYLFQYTW